MLKRARTLYFAFGLAINLIVSSVSFSQDLQPKRVEVIHDIDKCAFAGIWIYNTTQDISGFLMKDATIYNIETIVNKVNGNLLYSTQTYSDSLTGKMESYETEYIISGLKATGSSVTGYSHWTQDIELTIIEGGRRLYHVRKWVADEIFFGTNIGLATRIAGGSCL